MYFKAAAEIAVALLAVFGAYALFRLFVTARFLPHRRVVLVRVPSGTCAEEIALSLRELREEALLFDGVPVVCLLEEPVCAEIKALLDGEGICYYQIFEEGGVRVE
jgi:hypothetical protein